MIILLIAFAAAVYFVTESKKRGQNSFKWFWIALGTFFGPQLVLPWLVTPVVMLFGVSTDIAIDVYNFVAYGSLILGFYFLVLARKKLYSYERLEPVKDKIVITSLDIVDNEDGTFSVSGKVFKSKNEAEDYVKIISTLNY